MWACTLLLGLSREVWNKQLLHEHVYSWPNSSSLINGSSNANYKTPLESGREQKITVSAAIFFSNCYTLLYKYNISGIYSFYCVTIFIVIFSTITLVQNVKL
jgi:hypothetical protein